MEASELQTEPTDDVELETGETGAESAPAEEAKEPEKAPDGYIKAEEAQKDINKQHKRFRDEERKRKAIEAETDRLRAENESLKAKDGDLTIPAIPDQYDENYQDKIRQRDEAIQRKAAHDNEVKANEADQKRVAEQAKTDQEAKTLEKVQGFDANVIQLGLSPGEVKKAANEIIDYGLSENLEDILLEDPDGPLMVAHLASNPVELDALNAMTPYQLMTNLAELKAKASVLKPKTSGAPPPPEVLSGGGVGEIEDPLLAGVKFE